jgi:hypothetical protein
VGLEAKVEGLAKHIRRVFKNQTPAKGRSCGGCDLCCTILRVAADEWKEPKLSFDPCRYLIKHRCTVYKGRPEVCRTYQCSWLDGTLPDKYAPQKTGIVVNIEGFLGKPMWIAYLTHPTVHHRPIGIELLSGLISSQLMPVVVVKRRFWDDEMQQQMKEILVVDLDGQHRPFYCPEEPGDRDEIEGPAADWLRRAVDASPMEILE